MKFHITLLLSLAWITLVSQINSRINVPFNDVQNPLTGGFEAPQFQAINLNEDDKKDLLVFDRKGSAIRTFVYDENLPFSYRYAPEYESVFPAMPCWVIVRDFDNDGIDDLFTCGVTDPVTGIEVWKGSREDGELKYSAVNHPYGPYNIIFYEAGQDYKQLYVGNNGIPGIRDVDGDGDIDILAFQPSGGYLYYFQNMSQERGFDNDSLIYIRADDCWGNFYEGGLIPDIVLSEDNENCAVPNGLLGDVNRHEGITLSIFDKNTDGLQDLLIGEVSSTNLIYVENGGTINDAFATKKEVDFPSEDVPANIQIFLGSFILDVDQDGDEDLLVAPNSQFGTNTNQVSYYENEDSDYNLIQEDWLVEHTLDFGTDSYPAFFDYNADGLIDLVIGSYGLVGLETGVETRLYLYENVGTADDPAYMLVDDNYLDFLDFTEFDASYIPSFGDLDGDGDQDMMLGTLSGELVYLENEAGPGSPADFGSPVFDFQGLDSKNNTTRTEIMDINGDGLGDIIVGGRNSYTIGETIGSLRLFLNQGSEGDPQFDNGNFVDGLGGVNVKDAGNSRVSAAPRFYQNGDEMLLFIGNEVGRIALYRIGPEGEDYTLVDDDLLEEYVGRRVGIDIADIDNDGYLEMVVGNERGGLNFFNTIVQVSGEISSITEVTLENLELFPNPVHNVLNIRSDSSEDWQLYNGLGQFLKVLSSNQSQIDVRDLKPGTYFLRSATRIGRFVKL